MREKKTKERRKKRKSKEKRGKKQLLREKEKERKSYRQRKVQSDEAGGKSDIQLGKKTKDHWVKK